VVSVRIAAEPPADIGAVVGHAAHNLRSALDEMAWQLALLTTKTPYHRTQFPIFTDAQAYSNGGQRMIRDLLPEHARFIETLQPYNDAEPKQTILHILNRLSNVDKHRQLHLANTALLGADHRLSGRKRRRPAHGRVEINGAFDFGVTDEDGIRVLRGVPRRRRARFPPRCQTHRLAGSSCAWKRMWRAEGRPAVQG